MKKKLTKHFSQVPDYQFFNSEWSQVPACFYKRAKEIAKVLYDIVCKGASGNFILGYSLFT
ncbi:hypothetical protein [Algoriphagus yeomjeoni]|uniref:hypothetical protein n=1 Tax=Algoriphagus yeomjeoni TaxID=291403 RepID=UPI0011B93948|nr:hypothetical protein [Algoriphagus yeomjeoni]